MKKISYILFALALAVVFTGCKREEPAMLSSVQITFKLPAEFNDGVKYGAKNVVLSSTISNLSLTTDANGAISIPALIPDEYNISTVWEITGAEYKSITTGKENTPDNAKVIIKGAVIKKRIYQNDNILIDLKSIEVKTLMISKIYLSGTVDNMGKALISDGYIEIFNASDDVQYIDGKYLALTETISPREFFLNDRKDSIVVKQICKFPGTGQDFPIEPGKTLLIAARNAQNHTLVATTSADLSRADFEVKDMNGSGNPAVKALPLISNTYPTMKYLNTLKNGINGIVLFETTEDVLSWKEFYRPGKTSGDMYRCVPNSAVIDGVDGLQNKVVTGPNTAMKHLHDVIDAGFTNINSTEGGTHECMYRKVISEPGAPRLILQDTNFSNDDFVLSDDPTPRKYGTVQL